LAAEADHAEFEMVISHKKTALGFRIDGRLGMMIEPQLASQISLLNPYVGRLMDRSVPHGT
jgi:hypothetical protein